jgi:hypothetical protein
MPRPRGAVTSIYRAATMRRSKRLAAAASLRVAIASAEYLPCFQFAFRLRARPSGARGPLLAPPCIRHRRFRMGAAAREVIH